MNILSIPRASRIDRVVNDVDDSSSFISYRRGDPLAALAQWRVEMMAADKPCGILRVKFELPQYLSLIHI